MKTLKDLAPTVAISVTREHDPDGKWDGEAPDPTDQGYVPCVVVVRVFTIVNGEIAEGTSYLGNSYYKPEEDTGMAHGYLPQMIEEAITELLRNHPMVMDLVAARGFLVGVMNQIYGTQVGPWNQVEMEAP